MNKTKQICFFDDGNSEHGISVEYIRLTTNGESTRGIEISIGRCMGCDGENYIFTPEEFEEFLNACYEILMMSKGE